MSLPDRVVLVGLMGAGKSTVGPLLARRLGHRFVDLDELVQRRAGATISEIFATGGEARFRALELEAARALDRETGVVVAAGGGWMARAELADRWPDAVRVWLRVRPETAVARLGRALASRPLLAVDGASGGFSPDSARAMARRLLAAREKAYARAEVSVDTEDRTPEEVAEAAFEALRNLSPRSRLRVRARPQDARSASLPRRAEVLSAENQENGPEGVPPPDPPRTSTEDDTR